MVFSFFYLWAGTSACVHSACVLLSSEPRTCSIYHVHTSYYMPNFATYSVSMNMPFFHPIAHSVKVGKHFRSVQLWNEDAIMTVSISQSLFLQVISIIEIFLKSLEIMSLKIFFLLIEFYCVNVSVIELDTAFLSCYSLFIFRKA